MLLLIGQVYSLEKLSGSKLETSWRDVREQWYDDFSDDLGEFSNNSDLWKIIVNGSEKGEDNKNKRPNKVGIGNLPQVISCLNWPLEIWEGKLLAVNAFKFVNFPST